ncbi:MAG: hypothetical protein ACYDHX_04700 [Methanothrix sp.]
MIKTLGRDTEVDAAPAQLLLNGGQARKHRRSDAVMNRREAKVLV